MNGGAPFVPDLSGLLPGVRVDAKCIHGGCKHCLQLAYSEHSILKKMCATEHDATHIDSNFLRTILLLPN